MVQFINKSVHNFQSKSFTKMGASNSTETIMPQQPLLSIQLASDLHLEFKGVPDKNPSIPVNSKILALLGDIGNPTLTSYKEFLLLQSSRFEYVFVIAGNHEYYGLDVTRAKQLIRNICSTCDNLIFLDRNSFVYNVPDSNKTIKFLGCTLWTNVPAKEKSIIQECLNDYRNISNGDKKISVQDTVRWHREETEWLEQEIDQSMKLFVF
jgi:hypothetical protein